VRLMLNLWFIYQHHCGRVLIADYPSRF
jgi:hypothetical protein